jgi:hypothetical protein
LSFIVLVVGLPALAQTQFSGQITSNTSAPVTLANPVYYNETITAVGVSTTGALSCAAYPQVTFFYTRAGAFLRNVSSGVVAASGLWSQLSQCNFEELHVDGFLNRWRRTIRARKPNKLRRLQHHA